MLTRSGSGARETPNHEGSRFRGNDECRANVRGWCRTFDGPKDPAYAGMTGAGSVVDEFLLPPSG